MQTCLFCRNTRIFNIHSDYGNNNNTVKEDMIQFFGHQIESHLKPEDALCNLCMNIMDHVAKLKRRLLPLIFREQPAVVEDSKPLNFGKKWDVFASLSFSEGNDPFLLESRSPTPNNLLTCKRVVPYETPLEMKLAELERYRSASHMSITKSEPDSEIIDLLSKKRGRRKKRGHNWSKRKNGRYSRASEPRKSVMSTSSSRRSSLRSRPQSSLSISSDSYEPFCPPDQRMSPVPSETPSASHGSDDRSSASMRTRSVTRQLQEAIAMSFADDELHECSEKGCTFICEDIDLMARHKVNRHHQLDLFWCSSCGKKYTSSADLEIHKKTHSKQFPCAICHKEFYLEKDLLDHWQEHVKKSVPCKYCGKRFIDKKICDKHQQNVHKQDNPRRIDYNKCSELHKETKGDFEVKILIQEPRPRESPS